MDKTVGTSPAELREVVEKFRALPPDGREYAIAYALAYAAGYAAASARLDDKKKEAV